ncbi:hypothetical protein AKJ16_DCAP07922 [Drosera capensis]
MHFPTVMMQSFSMRYYLAISVLVGFVLVKGSIALKSPHDRQEAAMLPMYDLRVWPRTMVGDHMDSRETFGADREETRRLHRRLRVKPPSVPSPNHNTPNIQGPPAPPPSLRHPPRSLN